MDIQKLQNDINIQVNEGMTLTSYRAYDFRIARYIGLEPAILLTYLCEQDKYINRLQVGKEFYKQQKYIEFYTSLSSRQQILALKKLKQLEIIEVVKKGMPARNHFKINYNKILEVKNKVMDDFYGEIEKFDYNKDTDSSGDETGPLVLPKGNHINNNNLNILSSNNILSKDNNILEVDSQESTYIGSDNININNNKECNDNEIVSKMDTVVSTPKKAPRGTPPGETKKKGGLAPLIEMIDAKYDKTKYITLNIGLRTYLKAHIGCRKLPSIEKWQTMLDNLYEYSSIKVVGASGTKFIENNAIQIVERALNLKGDAPYPDFDNIFRIPSDENEISFNLEKGY